MSLDLAGTKAQKSQNLPDQEILQCLVNMNTHRHEAGVSVQPPKIVGDWTNSEHIP